MKQSTLFSKPYLQTALHHTRNCGLPCSNTHGPGWWSLSIPACSWVEASLGIEQQEATMILMTLTSIGHPSLQWKHLRVPMSYFTHWRKCFFVTSSILFIRGGEISHSILGGHGNMCQASRFQSLTSLMSQFGMKRVWNMFGIWTALPSQEGFGSSDSCRTQYINTYCWTSPHGDPAITKKGHLSLHNMDIAFDLLGWLSLHRKGP